MDRKSYASVIGAVVAWLWSVYTWRKNQDAERAQKEYQRKELLYREMFKSMVVFYKNNSGAAVPFIEQYRLAWLYAPDEIIRSLAAFMAAAKLPPPPGSIPADANEQLRAKALAELVASARKDLFATTKLPTVLTAADFQHYS
jgi:hypothetical protein